MKWKSEPYQPHIDGLRALAVVAVTLFHFKFTGFSGGFVGVDIFFVISGYLISRRIRDDLESGELSLTDFYAGRFRRIFPALLATVVISTVIAVVSYSPGALSDYSQSALTALVSVSNVWFWQNSGYFDAAAETYPLLHTWSLGVEVQFYVAWPLMAFALWKLLGSRWLLATLPLICLGAMIAEMATRYDPTLAFFLTPFRISEFLMGAAILLFERRLRNLPRLAADVGVVLGGFLMVAPIITFTNGTSFPGLNAMIVCAGAAAAIIWGGKTRIAFVLQNPLSSWLGRLSFSIYLVHWPLIVFLHYHFIDLEDWTSKLMALAVCLVLAHVLHTFVEKPFRQRCEYRYSILWGGASRKLIAPTLVAVLALAAGAITSGLPSRVAASTDKFGEIADAKRFHRQHYGGRACEEEGCTVGAGARRIYVIGDSFARALFEGMRVEFPDFEVRIYGPSSCMFFSLEYTPSNVRPACLKVRPQVFEEIRERPGLVIIEQAWLGYTNREISKTSDRSLAAETRPLEAFSIFAQQELRQLRDGLGGVQLLIMGMLPQNDLPLSPLDCIMRPLGQANCGYSSVESWPVRDAKQFNDVVLNSLSRSFRTLDPFDYLCDQRHCINFFADGYPVYSDRGHLSTWGSRYIVREIKAAILATF